MKNPIVFCVLLIGILLFTTETDAQVKINLLGKINKEANKLADKKAKEAVSSGIDKMEQGIKGSSGNENTDEKDEGKKEEASTMDNDSSDENRSTDKIIAAEASPTLSWDKYDFIPGDAVIFEDDQAEEENGEFPSRWDLVQGNIEIARVDGENVIMMREGAPAIVPYLKDPQEDYLPDVFTVELDLFYPGDGTFEIYLYDRKNQKSGSPTGYTAVKVQSDQMIMGQARSSYPDENLRKARWMHIAIAYTDGKLKAYMDDTRLINIPRLDFNPKGITLYTYHARNDYRYYVRNVRIARGGVKYYDRVMQDGKIIVNGIRFDVGKATLRLESMGAINEIYSLLKENPGLKFSIEGHTDSQGDDALNMQLSQDRAETVMKTLINMGISSDRLTAKGWGESKPISNNASPEDMANNRRVEFVKI